MKIVIETDDSVSKEDIQEWINETKENTPGIKDIHIACNNCKCFSKKDEYKEISEKINDSLSAIINKWLQLTIKREENIKGPSVSDYKILMDVVELHESLRRYKNYEELEKDIFWHNALKKLIKNTIDTYSNIEYQKKMKYDTESGIFHFFQGMLSGWEVITNLQELYKLL